MSNAPAVIAAPVAPVVPVRSDPISGWIARNRLVAVGGVAIVLIVLYTRFRNRSSVAPPATLIAPASMPQSRDTAPFVRQPDTYIITPPTKDETVPVDIKSTISIQTIGEVTADRPFDVSVRVTTESEQSREYNVTLTLSDPMVTNRVNASRGNAQRQGSNIVRWSTSAKRGDPSLMTVNATVPARFGVLGGIIVAELTDSVTGSTANDAETIVAKALPVVAPVVVAPVPVAPVPVAPVPIAPNPVTVTPAPVIPPIITRIIPPILLPPKPAPAPVPTGPNTGPSGAVTLYQYRNFGGRKGTVSSDNSNSANRGHRIYGTDEARNADIESFRVGPGMVFIAFAEPDFRGHRQEFRHDAAGVPYELSQKGGLRRYTIGSYQIRRG